MKWPMRQLLRLQVHLEKPWYPWVLAFLFFIEHFVLVIPLDILLVTSVLATPKRWVKLLIASSVGFALGAVLFAYLVLLYGLSIVEKLTPGITHNAIWLQSEAWMHHYGLLAVGFFSMVPLTMHPLIAIAALNQVSLIMIGLAILAGRLFKYGILAWIAAHAPAHLHQFKFFRDASKKLESADSPDRVPGVIRNEE
ncbi:MAG: hypothetical protein H7333_09615 [Bdellovibrionales bacterium]|nr:hypothetical protein [Oligoflexia bacterium]